MIVFLEANQRGLSFEKNKWDKGYERIGERYLMKETKGSM